MRIAEDRGIREAERRRKEEEEQAAREAAWRDRQEELERQREQKYQAAIKRGGYDAAMARWDKAYGESIEKTGRGLCQWQDEIDGEYMGRDCYNRTANVYCAKHNRQCERESRLSRRKTPT